MTDLHQPGRPYFRTPAISPDSSTIAFVYAADIWLVDSHGGFAERLTAHPAGHALPRWSRDGRQIAFQSSRTGMGDIYVLPIEGGGVRRLTFHDEASTPEDWSPDGEHLFFSSDRDQQESAFYRVAMQGGTPIQWIGQPYENLRHLSVSPDGALLAFNVSRDRWWRRGPNPYGGAQIWVVGSEPGASNFHRVSGFAGLNRWPRWSPDGRGLYFVSDYNGVENIWFQPLDDGPPRQVTHFDDGRLLWPTISADGRTIVFERNFAIWRLEIASGEAHPVPIKVRADTRVTPVNVFTYTRDFRELALAPDGKKVAFVARGNIFLDFADKEVDKDRRLGPAFRATNTSARESQIAWLPDSRRLVYVTDRHGDEEIYLYDVIRRSESRLTDSAGPKMNPLPSPDGAWIAYARGTDELRLLHLETHEDRLFVRAQFIYFPQYAWSPDSRWLVFAAQDERLFTNLYVQSIDSDQSRQITFLSNLRAYTPLWSSNGRFIVFTTEQYRAESQIARLDLRPPDPFFREEEFEKLFSPGEQRAEQPAPAPAQQQPPATPAGETTPEEPAATAPAEQAPPPQSSAQEQPAASPSIEIVFEGIERRLRFLTPTQMDAYAQDISPDSRDLLFIASVAGQGNLWALPLDEPRDDQPPRQVTFGTSHKRSARFSPDGKNIYFLDNDQIMIRRFPSGDQNQLYTSAEVIVNFADEKLQIFEECWRLLRDRFYDPSFRGLDWNAAREQYAPLAAGAQTVGELHLIINLMVGELGTSHLGVFPAWGYPVQDGYLGLVFDRAEQVAHGRLRVATVVPDSPAAQAHGGEINAGDYLLAIDGVPVKPDTNIDTLLQRTIGRRVLLRVGPLPIDERARDVAIRPTSAGHYDELRYRDWVYRNETYVHTISNGRLGYVHIREMSYAAYQQFLVDLDVEAHNKEGIVVDVRFNGGGHTATFILDVLSRRSLLLSAFRNQPLADASHLAGNRILNKPTVLVINESSGSNTEMFTEGYRRLGLGRVVGRPSAGAVIWTTEHYLIDGSRFRLPYIKVATPEGEDLEGTGRSVDVDVALPLGAAAQGRDPQLDAAVRTLLEQIDSA